MDSFDRGHRNIEHGMNTIGGLNVISSLCELILLFYSSLLHFKCCSACDGAHVVYSHEVQ